MTNVKTLVPQEPSKERVNFGEHLMAFVAGMTDDVSERKKLIKTASKQFAGLYHNFESNCQKCYGRGFTGYNTTFGYYVPCPHCLNTKKLKKAYENTKSKSS